MNDCTRWAAIEDKLATGEKEGVDLPFWRAHPETCEACRAERDLLVELRTLSSQSPASNDLDELSEIDRAIVERSVSAHVRERRRGRSVRIGAGAVALLAIAAALVLVLRPRPPGPLATNPPPSNGTSAGASILTTIAWAGSAHRPDGSTFRAGDRVAVGDEVRSGAEPVCLRSDDDAFVCLGPASTLRIAEASPTRRAFEVVSGRVVASLAHQKAGASFLLAGGGLEARAVGTVYSLEVGRGPSPVVRVLDGIVGVSRGASTPKAEVRVDRHQRMAAFPSAEPVTRAEEEADAALLDLVEHQRRFTMVAELAPVADAGVDPPTVAPHPSTPPSTKPAASPARSPGEWLTEAREARRAGRSADAVKTYESLLRAYPDGDEAQAARLSLAELKLGAGQASTALRMFDEYIAKGGPLDQEAREGRIRALRALGRTGEERAAIADFLARFPKSVHAPRLEARAKELSP